MARVVPFQVSLPYGGLGRARTQVGRLTAVGALLFLLALGGSLAMRAAALLRCAFADWAQTRRRRAEDRQLLEVALTDPRLMADLVALQQRADVRR